MSQEKIPDVSQGKNPRTIWGRLVRWVHKIFHIHEKRALLGPPSDNSPELSPDPSQEPSGEGLPKPRIIVHPDGSIRMNPEVVPPARRKRTSVVGFELQPFEKMFWDE